MSARTSQSGGKSKAKGRTVHLGDVRVTRLQRAAMGGWLFAFSCSDTTTFYEAARLVRERVGIRGEAVFLKDAHCWFIYNDDALHTIAGFLPHLRALLDDEDVDEGDEDETATGGASAPAGSALHAAYTTLHMLPTMPWPVIRAAYRALALLYHPDTGTGDPETMKRINVAYDVLCAAHEADNGAA